MAKLFSEYESEMRFIVPDCPTPVMERGIRLSLKEFCERSWFWRVTLDTMAVAGDEQQVDLFLPSDTTVVVPLKATYDELPLEIVTDRSTLTTQVGQPSRIYVEDDVAFLSPVPSGDASTGLSLRVALKPLDTATSVDDRIVKHFNETIIHGAARYLLMMPGFSWTNPQLAAWYHTQFAEGIFHAKRKGDGSDAPVVRTVKYGGY